MQIRSNTFAQPLRQPQQRAAGTPQEEGPQDGFKPSPNDHSYRPPALGKGLA